MTSCARGDTTGELKPECGERGGVEPAEETEETEELLLSEIGRGNTEPLSCSCCSSRRSRMNADSAADVGDASGMIAGN